ncbi:hypothetical protein Hanom_Chr02g00124721 [Helianthus anomalus]
MLCTWFVLVFHQNLVSTKRRIDALDIHDFPCNGSLMKSQNLEKPIFLILFQ